MAFEPQTVENFIGRGITLPLNIVNGSVPLETGFPLIRKSIKMILDWQFGTRFFLKEFGSRLNELLEEPDDNVLAQLIETFIIDAVTTWETRVTIISINFIKEDIGKIKLTINYRVVNTQRDDSFIYPFYTKIIY